MNALILGATGLVGHELLELLIFDNRFTKIDLLSRRELDLRSIKVTNHVLDLTNVSALPYINHPDVLFITFGTTIKKAGSKRNQFAIDVEIPEKIMQLAKEKGVKKCVLISALGVAKYSPFFYSRMKANLEERAKKIGFEQLIIVKPSVLEGPRIEKRKGEELSVIIGNAIAKTGLIDKYKPVNAIDAAKSMIQCLYVFENGIHYVNSDEIHLLAKKYTEQEWQFKADEF
jgi:uncharacterized protein YbjT (DUF2867 family)